MNLDALKVYADRRMVGLGFLGFSSGLPRLLVYSTLTFWLLEHGLSIAAVGLFAATSLPYNLKFFWSPILDRVRLPLLSSLLGVRRSWLLVTQLALLGSLLWLATGDPGEAVAQVATAALLVAFWSASQDIVIDAYRVELLEDDEQGAGAAVAVFGYRIGMLAASAGALYLADASSPWFSGIPFAVTPQQGHWQFAYTVMAALMSVGIVTTLLMREPEAPARDTDRGSIAAQFSDAVIGPFKSLMARQGTLLILAFIVVYKLGDALAGTMTNPLLQQLGFEKTTIANVAKTFGLVSSITGVFLGGALVRKLGVLRALWVSGFLQMASNLMFSLQALVGANTAVLVATIGIENLSGGLGTAAFVAYLSSLCDKRYTATQYAFLTAASSVLQTALSTSAGAIAEATGWPLYFVLTTVAAFPGLFLLWLLTRREGSQPV